MRRLALLVAMIMAMASAASGAHRPPADPIVARTIMPAVSVHSACSNSVVPASCFDFAAYDRGLLALHLIAGRDNVTPSHEHAFASAAMRFRDQVRGSPRAVTYTIEMTPEESLVRRPNNTRADMRFDFGYLGSWDRAVTGDRSTLAGSDRVPIFKTIVYRSPSYAKGARIPDGRVEPIVQIGAWAMSGTTAGVPVPPTYMAIPVQLPTPGRAEVKLLLSVRRVVARSALMIERIVYASDGRAPTNENLNREFVVLRNVGPTFLSLSGWRLADEDNNAYRFPEGITLRPGAKIRLHTGSGRATARDLYWGKRSFVWDDGGERALLYDRHGPQVCEYKPRPEGFEDCWR